MRRMQRISRAAYVERLKDAVSESFTFTEGETFEEWVERAQTLNPSQRAMLATRMGSTQRKLLGEYFARKRAWIAAARQGFEPRRREPCFVCGKFEAITQAHHVVPLNEQFEHGFEVPDHEHEWLCPNHHVTLHLWIDRSSSEQHLGRRAAPSIAEVPLEQFGILMDLVGRSGRTTPTHARAGDRAAAQSNQDF
jgi:hypothetical protein